MKGFLLFVFLFIVICSGFASVEGELTQDDFVYVRHASFQMGDTRNEGENDEEPIHKVSFTYDFYIGKTEITNEQYCLFLNDSGFSPDGFMDEKMLIDINDRFGYCQIAHDGNKFYVENDKEKFPVVEVSWWGAIYFCNWLSEKKDLEICYDLVTGNLINYPYSKGYRLPTEAEWEFSARGGTTSDDSPYSGSYNIDEVSWYEENFGGTIKEVATKKPNKLGIFDMSGNAMELCNDWYRDDYYFSSPSTNPVNMVESYFISARGGSCYDDAYNCRVSVRDYTTITGTDAGIGFRICSGGIFDY